jgi:hypothetical protein
MSEKGIIKQKRKGNKEKLKEFVPAMAPGLDQPDEGKEIKRGIEQEAVPLVQKIIQKTINS